MWYSPSLQQLLFLEMVLEEGSLVRAAHRLHTTHSTVSRGLKALGSGLGIALFYKTPNGLALTDAGRIYGSEVRKVLEQAYRAFDLAQYEIQKNRLPFRVGHSPYIHGQLLPVLNSLRLPGAEAPPIVLESARTQQLVHRVLNGKLEAGFGVLPIADKDLWVGHVAREPFAVCLSENHRLARHAKLSARLLLDENIVWIPRSVHRDFYGQIFGYLRSLECIPPRMFEAHTITQALDFAAANAGAALVPRSAMRFTRPGIVFRPLTDQLMQIDTGLFARRDRMHDAVKDFLGVAIASIHALSPMPMNGLPLTGLPSSQTGRDAA